MNFARVAAAAVAAWVAYLPIGYIVNEILLSDLYAANAAAMRAPEEMNLPLGFAASLLGFFVFAYTYAKGYEGGSGVQEGVRFGVLVGFLLICFATVWTYVTAPITSSLLFAWIVDVIVEFSIYGAIVGAIYRPVSAGARKVVSA
ncbi:MAG: hypothetical protein ACRD26_18050 [Vicinamibacterales bacterium]